MNQEDRDQIVRQLRFKADAAEKLSAKFESECNNEGFLMCTITKVIYTQLADIFESLRTQ